MKRHWLQKRGTNTVCQWNPELAKLADMVPVTHERAMELQAAADAERRANVLAKSMGMPPELAGLSSEEVTRRKQIEEGLIPASAATPKRPSKGPKPLSEMDTSELMAYAKQHKLMLPDGADEAEMRKAITEAHASLTAITRPAKLPDAPIGAGKDELDGMGMKELNVLCDQYGIPKSGTNDLKRDAIRAMRKAAQ